MQLQMQKIPPPLCRGQRTDRRVSAHYHNRLPTGQGDASALTHYTACPVSRCMCTHVGGRISTKHPLPIGQVRRVSTHHIATHDKACKLELTTKPATWLTCLDTHHKACNLAGMSHNAWWMAQVQLGHAPVTSQVLPSYLRTRTGTRAQPRVLMHTWDTGQPVGIALV